MPNIDESAKEWQLALACRVGSIVRRRRKALGLTAVQLAQRTIELGYPITRVAISKIEGNYRSGKLDLAELMVLAAALDIPPLWLIFPTESEESSALPTIQLSDDDARDWMVGREPLPGRGVNPGVQLYNSKLELHFLALQLPGDYQGMKVSDAERAAIQTARGVIVGEMENLRAAMARAYDELLGDA
ncbi:helix-turn-helix domain-containing protein [Mycolicibacter minnesotensis]